MNIGPRNPLVCIRTVEIPHGKEDAFYEWIESNRELRLRYGILMERILNPATDRVTGSSSPCGKVRINSKNGWLHPRSPRWMLQQGMRL